MNFPDGKFVWSQPTSFCNAARAQKTWFLLCDNQLVSLAQKTIGKENHFAPLLARRLLIRLK
jgi:hypothetical protein